MKEGLAGAAQARDQRKDCRQMVAIGGVDHPIGALRLADKECRIIQATRYRVDAQRAELFGIALIPHQATDAMARIEQSARDCSADESTGAGDKDLHVVVLETIGVWWHVGLTPGISGGAQS